MTQASSSIFLVDQHNRLIELQPSAYASEALLQGLLADHPNLLGAAGPPGAKLLLIRREFVVPGEPGGSGRWSLDHLFVASDGVPVLVEVKRATDTRARREVVAQMLDYAANGVAYWPVDRIVAAHAETARARGEDPDEALRDVLNGGDPEVFWRQVEANLRSGRVRLVFVADLIAPELRRIIEFLNEQMRPAEVLAIEVGHFSHPDGLRTLVPRVVGQTQRAQAIKAIQEAGEPVSEEEWLARLTTRHGPAARSVAERALLWFRDQGFAPSITSSGDSVGLSIAGTGGGKTWPFFIRLSTGRLEIALVYLKNNKAFAAEADRRALLERMRAIPGTVTTDNPQGWPGIPLDRLIAPEDWQAFRSLALDIRDTILRNETVHRSDQAGKRDATRQTYA